MVSEGGLQRLQNLRRNEKVPFLQLSEQLWKINQSLAGRLCQHAKCSNRVQISTPRFLVSIVIVHEQGIRMKCLCQRQCRQFP
jgi:hypothetical protein